MSPLHLLVFNPYKPYILSLISTLGVAKFTDTIGRVAEREYSFLPRVFPPHQIFRIQPLETFAFSLNFYPRNG